MKSNTIYYLNVLENIIQEIDVLTNSSIDGLSLSELCFRKFKIYHLNQRKIAITQLLDNIEK